MRILASDYDGTLNYGGIDKKKIDAISRWQAQGNLFALVSGRGADDAIRIYNQQKFPCDYILACNGAVIMTTDKHSLLEVRCDGAVIKEFCEFLFSLDCPFANIETTYTYSGSYRVVPCSPEDGQYIPDNIPETDYFNQISTMLEDDDAAAKVCDAINERFGEYFNPLQNGRCIDIVRKDINKAKGIKMLVQYIQDAYDEDITLDDVIAVGDNINDYHMINEFTSYAMENGVDAIKEIATYITPSVTALIEKELEK